ncbi:Hypothetical predicted protein [Lecanosticta acicola]|uniref:Uncharacterized protein n=1 Tax=Lecanosticta acicola TaxID=111012 RepID=A0AAI8Z3V1_9PEZI|nr:Hypothetical predicted protein [Lecanosticta acicola]
MFARGTFSNPHPAGPSNKTWRKKLSFGKKLKKHPASKPPKGGASPFQSLPRELRDKIYYCVFDNEPPHPKDCFSSFKQNMPKRPMMAQACRKVRKEMEEVYYKRGEFTQYIVYGSFLFASVSTTAIKEWLEEIGESNAAKINSLSVKFFTSRSWAREQSSEQVVTRVAEKFGLPVSDINKSHFFKVLGFENTNLREDALQVLCLDENKDWVDPIEAVKKKKGL